MHETKTNDDQSNFNILSRVAQSDKATQTDKVIIIEIQDEENNKKVSSF